MGDTNDDGDGDDDNDGADDNDDNDDDDDADDADDDNGDDDDTNGHDNDDDDDADDVASGAGRGAFCASPAFSLSSPHLPLPFACSASLRLLWPLGCSGYLAGTGDFKRIVFDLGLDFNFAVVDDSAGRYSSTLCLMFVSVVDRLARENWAFWGTASPASPPLPSPNLRFL